MSPQAKMQAKLSTIDIPHKEIRVYGSQIVVTAWSREAADKWAALIGRFAKVRNIIESLDETATPKGPHSRDKFHKVWRVFATI